MPLSPIVQLFRGGSVLLVEKTGVPGENHQSVTSHWQTLSHNAVSSTPRHEWGSNSQLLVVTGIDCTGSCQTNYHTILTMTAPFFWNCFDSVGGSFCFFGTVLTVWVAVFVFLGLF